MEHDVDSPISWSATSAQADCNSGISLDGLGILTSTTHVCPYIHLQRCNASDAQLMNFRHPFKSDTGYVKYSLIPKLALHQASEDYRCTKYFVSIQLTSAERSPLESKKSLCSTFWQARRVWALNRGRLRIEGSILAWCGWGSGRSCLRNCASCGLRWPLEPPLKAESDPGLKHSRRRHHVDESRVHGFTDAVSITTPCSSP